MASQKKAAYFTLGCKLNFSETSTIAGMLAERGFTRAQGTDIPDIVVVNTCSVTETADKKARNLIRRLTAKWPGAIMVVTGCYAQLKPREVADLPGVDIVIGSNEKLRLLQFLDSHPLLSTPRQSLHNNSSPLVATSPYKEITTFRPSCQRGDRTRWWLKIQDGCDYFCTYCTIPFARGRSRSGLTPDLVDQARDAAAKGAREIVITGVNIGEYGRDNGQSFLDLLKRLDDIDGIQRYRISSIEPNLLTEDILRWIATDARAFMPHFHIPLQSGSDEVLRLMNRRYDTSLFRDRVDLIRQLIPDAFIGVDVIAGARGETPARWEKSLQFIDSLPVTRLHVFPYSERPGTTALHLADPVPQAERHRRVALLTAISDKKLAAFFDSQLGQTRPVLWEHPTATGSIIGLTDNYIRIVAETDGSILPNTITPVRLVAHATSHSETLLGQIITEA